MSSSRKIGPIRQLSLHSAETPTRRKGFKKQFSEDILDSKQKWIPELGFHVSLCTKSQIKTLDRPPPAKLAWIENRHQESSQEATPNKNEEGIVAKKCKEVKRPVTTKMTRQASLNKDSILLSHQELAERLRKAWKDREKGKQNLNIFLAHNVKEKPEEEFNGDLTDSEGTFVENNAFDKIVNKPKIILPLKPESLASNAVNYKNIFQKRMRRAHSIEEPFKDIAYSPTRTLEGKSRTVVVVPLVENPKLIPKQLKENSKIEPENKESVVKIQTTKVKEEEKSTSVEANGVAQQKAPPPAPVEEDKPIDVIIRPMTATSKREGFRSRTNSAFNGSGTKENQRPPLLRASSVPLKPAQPKPKFIAQKRRIKSASKKKEKTEKTEKFEAVEIQGELSGDEDKEDDNGKNKKFQRCVSVSGAEIITMVSLISPEESETEEHVEVEKEKPKSKTSSPTKTVSGEKNEKLEHQKNFTLRKVVKSVSFQQSSIHAVRSFSASFPARRGSVATALMLGNGGLVKTTGNGTQEKRGTLENVPDDVREPKRRLLRTKSVPANCSFDEKEEENSPLNQKAMENSTPSNVNTTVPQPKTAKSPETSSKPTSNQNSSNKSGLQEVPNENLNSEENPDNEPTFDTPKEKQCWDMYCKMSEKGVNISFDTILRGMLTPTEYRLRRKSAPAADNIADNTTDS